MKAGKIPVIVILLLSFFVLSESALAIPKYSGGSGTAGDPYKIGSAADLLTLAADANDYDANFILTADINLAASGPFTTAVIAPDTNNTNYSFEGTAFSGVFDGNGYTISNLIIDTDGAGNDYLGLFGYVGPGGEIKNLSLEDVSISGGDDSYRFGSLAGFNNAGTISNCYSTGNVTDGFAAGELGGLIGCNDGDINDCRSTVNIRGGDDSSDLGGLAGNNYGNISNCSSSGTASGGDSSDYIGGLAGRNSGGAISDCYASGKVNAGNSSQYFGGLTGRNYGIISNCYSTGAVTGGTAAQYLGGLWEITTAALSTIAIRRAMSAANLIHPTSADW
jgi:hypothetical protein